MWYCRRSIAAACAAFVRQRLQSCCRQVEEVDEEDLQARLDRIRNNNNNSLDEIELEALNQQEVCRSITVDDSYNNNIQMKQT